jgi:hypothetical protein
MDKTHAFKEESCHEDNEGKDRISVPVHAKMDGYGKMTLLVSGKSKKIKTSSM